ncbi:MAG: entry exclusion lipoprotein TrbK [Thermoleophilaceae bacterium]
MVRAAILVMTVLGGALLTGCGEDDPEPVKGAAKQVAATVARLELLTQRKDFQVICRELFTADARRRAGGDDCPKLLAETGNDVRAPRIELLSVTIDGESARAKVRTSARGQAPVEDQIELVRERGGYRIESLTS